MNINEADTNELIKLPMVSNGRARMIWKYRELLGGFISKEQLREVFTIDSIVYNVISPLIYIDNSLIKKLNLNADQIRHPYLTKSLLYAIKAYRKQHGDFKTIEEFKGLALVDEQLYVKLAPYLSIE